MPLYRPTYLVEYDPTQPPLEVAVASGDMMRAELEAHRLKIPAGANFNTTGLWLWAALVRMGREERRADEFLNDPPEWDPVKRTEEDGTVSGVQELVDPTSPEAGGPASGALLATETPVSG